MVPGPIEPFAEHTPLLILFLTIAGGAALTDLRSGKIYNVWVLPSIVIGFVVQSVLHGWPGALNSGLGILLGFALLIGLYLTKILGAGDIKFLMVFGAWGGTMYVSRVALLSILVGGVMAAFLLLIQGRLGSFLKRASLWFQFFFSGKGPRLEEIVDRKLTMPFGVPLAVSAVWLIYQNPFQSFGILR